MKVAFFSTKSYDKEYFDKLNNPNRHQLYYLESQLNEKTAKLVEGNTAVCAFVNDDVNKEVISILASKAVKLIALRSAGFNHVDIEAAFKNRIKVLRVPAYSPNSVAEHAVSLILTLNRKTHKAYNRIREGNFSLERLVGFDLCGKTVGVVGTGKIGTVFCNIMNAFGCKIMACDKYPSAKLISSGVKYVDLNELLKKSDIVSLHCPLTPDTHHLINEKTFRIMKDGVMLINTSRGGLVDTQAAIKMLKNGKLGYLGIDVYEQEESLFFKDLSEIIIQDDVISRLMSFPNVLITAHQAFFTENALQQIAKITLQNIADFEDGRKLDNEVTMEMIK